MKKDHPKRTVGDAIVKLIDNIADLADIKTILSVGLVGATVWGFMHDKLPVEAFVGVVSSVITYFFTKRSGGREADRKTNADGKDDSSGSDNT